MSEELLKLVQPVDLESPFASDADRLAQVMLHIDDMTRATKLLGFEYKYAWKLASSEEYEKAKIRRILEHDPNTELVRKVEIAFKLKQELHNEFDGTPATRIAAAKELNTMYGYNAPQEVNVKHDLTPTINLTLPEVDGDGVIDLTPEDDEGSDDLESMLA